MHFIYSTSLRLTCYEMDKKLPPHFWRATGIYFPWTNIANGWETTFIWGFGSLFRGFLLLVSGMGGGHATKKSPDPGLRHRVQVLPVPRILQRRSQLGCTMPNTGESSSSPREKMFDDGGNPWLFGTPRVDSTSTGLEGNKTQMPQTKREEDHLILLFAGNKLIFFSHESRFASSQVMVSHEIRQHLTVWEKNTKNSSFPRLVGNQVVSVSHNKLGEKWSPRKVGLAHHASHGSWDQESSNVSTTESEAPTEHRNWF